MILSSKLVLLYFEIIGLLVAKPGDDISYVHSDDLACFSIFY